MLSAIIVGGLQQASVHTRTTFRENWSNGPETNKGKPRHTLTRWLPHKPFFLKKVKRAITRVKEEQENREDREKRRRCRQQKK
jgi:hypothetical protein